MNRDSSKTALFRLVVSVFILASLTLCDADSAGAQVAPVSPVESLAAAAGAPFDGRRLLPATLLMPAVSLAPSSPLAPATPFAVLVPTLPHADPVSRLPDLNPEIVTLPELVDRLARDPRNVQALIDAIRGKTGPAGRDLPDFGGLDPDDKDRLIRAIQNADKSFLERFPTMTVRELQAFITWYGRRQGPVAPEPAYPSAGPLNLPGGPKDAADGAFLKDWGHGLYHGDFSLHGQPFVYGDNAAFAETLNRLAYNEPGRPPSYIAAFDGRNFTSVSELLTALADGGHAVVAKDMRMFANFGGIWHDDNGRWVSVAAPLFINTGLRLPSGRRLVVPASHSQLEIVVTGPKVNVDVIFYLGVGGSANFSANATAEKPWVVAHAAHVWRDARAIELAERAATARRELKAKVEKYHLPLGGYGPLGSCDDVHAMITGEAAYPQIRDMRYYNDGKEMDAWARTQPVDGASPSDPGRDLRRVWDSLPTHDLDEIKIPQFRETFQEFKLLMEGPNP